MAQLVTGWFFIYKGNKIEIEIQEIGNVSINTGNIEAMGSTVVQASTYEEAVILRGNIINGVVATGEPIVTKDISNGRTATVGQIPMIDYVNKIITVKLHIEPDNKDIILVANNSKLIGEVGDFDYLIDAHENQGVKISQLIYNVVTLRDGDGTIETKLQ